MVGDISVDCSNIEELLSVDEIVYINCLITEPKKLDKFDYSSEILDSVSKGFENSPEFEVAREEDYHSINTSGILGTLLEQILYHECQNSNNALWLSSKIIGELASNQAFYEGNKRTSYAVGVLFFVKCQIRNDSSNSPYLYPLLDTELTNVLSKVATRDLSNYELYKYLKKRLDKIR